MVHLEQHLNPSITTTLQKSHKLILWLFLIIKFWLSNYKFLKTPIFVNFKSVKNIEICIFTAN